MKLYVMRHGTSIWNEQGKTQGHSHNRLSLEGKQIVNQTAQKCKHIKFDVIFCSPLMRAVQSANIMNKFHKVKKIKDNRLMEVDQGIFTGKIYNKLSPSEIKQKESRSKVYGMESYKDAYARIKNFVEDIKQSNYENVLVITHHFVITCIEHILLNNGNFSSFKYKGNIDNGEIKLFEI